ncbi:MAG: hypothetical protein SNJ35_09160 [Rikenellaceae bacterium]
MINKTCDVFQVDSDIVQSVYKDQDNYLIEYDDCCVDRGCCAIYFCSNDIYFPNTEEVFRKRIIEKNFFEWYGSRIKRAYKHIFVRDIFKQWYLGGINSEINTPESLVALLQKETDGYKVTTVGSSAGGYAAILYGSQIGAERAIVFNPQFELNTLFDRSGESVNPLLYRFRNSDKSKYFDIVPFINSNMPIYYIFSDDSQWDISQRQYIGQREGVYDIPFNSSHHGIPFLKVALSTVLNLGDRELSKLSKKRHHPIFFTIKMVGIIKTVDGFVKQLYTAYRKRR